MADQTFGDIDHVLGANAVGHHARNRRLGSLINDGQALEPLAVGAPVEHEVIGPHVIGCASWPRLGSPRSDFRRRERLRGICRVAFCHNWCAR